MIIPSERIKVFVSSACGDDPARKKYNIMRAGLKMLIEATHFAKVYLFESEGASTLSARRHYTHHLEGCDVCIFLIDNSDGIPDGVQIEIDTANKHEIKSLYYFCDESSKNETPLQKSIKGADFAKSKTVHSFEEFIENGAKDLIEDLVTVYKAYCKGRMAWSAGEHNNKNGDITSSKLLSFSSDVANKDVLNGIDNCKKYFSQLLFGTAEESKIDTNEIDKACAEFLPVLFEGKGIAQNQFDSLTNNLKTQQTAAHFSVTEKRLAAIHSYFSNDSARCELLLKEALAIAKSKSLPTWVIKDILVDLRNHEIDCETARNGNAFYLAAQKELEDDGSFIYYPLIDRFNTNLYEKLSEERIKHAIQSPHTVSYGHSLAVCIDLIASSYVLAIYNGSLTQLNILYARLKSLAFFCAERYSNWNFKMLLLKTAILYYNSKETNGIMRIFGDILSKINASEACEIYRFADNRPVPYQRANAKLEAFRIIAYALDEEQFDNAWAELYDLILKWSKDDTPTIAVGGHIFSALEGAHLRISQNQLATIILECLSTRKRKFYEQLFKLISNCVNINNLSPELSGRLLAAIIEIVSDENERKNIGSLERTLFTLRKQDRSVTENLDKAISENMPDFYRGNYRLETTEGEIGDMPKFVEEYVKEIEKRNAEQGMEGAYLGYGNRPHRTILAILRQSDIVFSEELIGLVYKAASETVVNSRQDIEIKMEAIELMIFLNRTISGAIERNEKIVSCISDSKETVETGYALMTNLDKRHLRLHALLLYNSFGTDVNMELIEAIADIGDEELAQIHASKIFSFYLGTSDQMPETHLELIILQHALIWCHSSNLEVRWSAVMILFQLLQNSQSKSVICNKFVKMMDSDNVYIKNAILQKVENLKKIDLAAYNYIIQKGMLDANFLVRKVANEVSANMVKCPD